MIIVTAMHCICSLCYVSSVSLSIASVFNARLCHRSSLLQRGLHVVHWLPFRPAYATLLVSGTNKNQKKKKSSASSANRTLNAATWKSLVARGIRLLLEFYVTGAGGEKKAYSKIIVIKLPC